ncbi:MAG TPA: hypothetical protein VH415_07595 [Nitrososphaeraceae archaeon]|jgi:hypothetical protein
MIEIFILLLVGSLDNETGQTMMANQTNQTMMANQTNQTNIVDTLAQEKLDKLREVIPSKLVDKLEEEGICSSSLNTEEKIPTCNSQEQNK